MKVIIKPWLGLFCFGVFSLNVFGQSCVSPPAGLIGWWAAEGNAGDGAGTNNALLEGGTGFATGKVGLAFSLNQTNADVKVPASSSLDVGLGNGFTLEAWINCSDVANLNPIFEWNLGDGATQWGVHFYVGGNGPGSLYANVVDSGGGWHGIGSSTGILSSNVFQHVALTYDQAAGDATIYRNGVIVAQSHLSSFTPQTSYPLYIGRRPGPDAVYNFVGLFDEASVYNRALSSNEIVAIYQAGSSGKCSAIAPVIVYQPTNYTANVGGTAALTVVAGGTVPLSYQWNFNGTNILNATNASYTVANVQLSQAGNYAVTVTNLYGSAVSSNAVLTVNPPSCYSVPAGVAAWWPAEGSAVDIVGTNNGSPTAGLVYTNGMAGQAFSFTTSGSYIPLPASTALDIGASTNSGLTIECWVQPNSSVFQGGAPIIEWDSPSTDGLQLWVGATMSANLKDTSGISHGFQTSTNPFTTNAFQHVALTYDRSSGKALLYWNGTMVASNNVGTITPQSTYPVNIGRRTGQPVGNGSNFRGFMDELTLYKRALSAAEIQSIYQANLTGK
ncbi:MAG TPA: LamG-like jellyroll fold domain-containing protein, partial [Desulfuromonadaceae bacterium]|nr:LamG-like jellyroll fold domain-containing protein [Desulfuromonadaceae bacterium]